MSRNVWTMIKKELRRVFTDRRMVISLILPGLIVYVLYSVMGGFTSSLTGVDEDHVYKVYTVNAPAEFAAFNNTAAFDLDVAEASKPTDEILADIESEITDLYIVYEDDFYQKMLNYDVGNGDAPMIEMYYNSANKASSTIYSYYQEVFQAYEAQLTNRFDINGDTSVAYDQASDEDLSIMLITSLLPFLLMVFLYSGALQVSTESIAGEKERGTIATLLITPTKRSEIAWAKIISLSMITLVSATSSFLGVMLSFPRLMGGANVSMNIYGPGTYALLFVVIISTVLIYVVVLSIISAFAKTIKEANSLAVPLMVLNMLVGITAMLGITNTNPILYMIPLFNSVQSITSILSLEVSALNLGVTILSNLVVVGIGVFLLTKMFDSEKYMFNK